MARTQAVYYRDAPSPEPVDEFIQALPSKRAAKIDDFFEEYLGPPEMSTRRSGHCGRRTGSPPTSASGVTNWT